MRELLLQHGFKPAEQGAAQRLNLANVRTRIPQDRT
jgi:hypothetical protein